MKRRLRRPWFFAYIIVSIACVISVSVWATGTGQRLQRPITFDYKTEALTVTKAEMDSSGRSIRLAVQNRSKKNIDWFRISLGPESDIEADFAFADKSVLAPGESYEDVYPVSTKSDKIQIGIVSVVFQDKTSDGHSGFARRLLEKRSAQESELKRLLPLLNQAIKAPNKEQASILLKAMTDELNASLAVNESLPEATRIGLRTARERVLNDLKNVQESGEKERARDLRPDLGEVLARYNRVSSRLAEY